MRARLCAALATVAVGAAILPVYADSAPAATPAPKPQITDQAGDANGINDQGTGLNGSTAVLPVEDSAADITAVLFQTVFKTVTTTKTIFLKTKTKKGKVVTTKKTVTTSTKVPNGFTVTMTLSAAPDTNTWYDVQVTSPTCATGENLAFDYYVGPTSSPLAINTVSCLSNSNSTPVAGQAAVSGNTVVWTLPASAVPVGTKLTSLFAQTEAEGGPTLDEAYGADTASYTVGT